MTNHYLYNINKFKQSKKALDEARFFIDEEEYEKALKSARFAYRYHPNSEDAIFTYAQTLYICGYEKKAKSLFEKIENYKEPYYFGTGVYYYLALCYFMGNSNLYKALKLINKAIKIDKKNYINTDNDLFVKGRILYAMGYYDKILPYFENLYKSEPSTILEIYLSKIYYKKGDTLKGYLYFTKVFKSYENKSPNLTYEEIQVYLDMRRYEHSKEYQVSINNKIRQSIDKKLGICHLKGADVLIYSDKLALGLKYDKSIKYAPFIVYKSDNVDAAIKEAKRLNIETYETKITNKIYRRTLFQDAIDSEFYVPVAEIFAKAYNSKKVKICQRAKKYYLNRNSVTRPFLTQ